MKKAIWGFRREFFAMAGVGVFLILTVTGGEGLAAQETHVKADIEVLFNRVQVLCRGGESHAGLLAGVTDRALVIRLEGDEKAIPFVELEKVVIERTKSGNSSIVGGMLVGIYAGNLLVSRAKMHPPIYMRDIHSTGYLLSGIFYAVVGGGLAYLASGNSAKGEKVFDFSGDENQRARQRERLKSFVMGKDLWELPKVHLSFQGGYVAGGVGSRFRSELEKRGFYVQWEERSLGGETDLASRFNMLRKIQLSYSASEKVELGAAVYFLGEPSLAGYSTGDWPHDYVDQSTDITGYFAVAAFRPLAARKVGTFDWSVGIGAGAVDVDMAFYCATGASAKHRPNIEKLDDYRLQKTAFSVVVYTDLKFYIQRWISLGLAADYVYIPKENIPAFEGAGIPAQNKPLGTSSLGISLSFHFF